MNGHKQVLVIHNVRSAHNVGSMFRTADGLGVSRIYITGYTPHPLRKKDERLPHIAMKIDRHIHKTALGAENTVPWNYSLDIKKVLKKLIKENYSVVALEQTKKSIPLNKFKPTINTALIVGNELDGLDDEILSVAAKHIEIPMSGKKESYNVAIAAAIAMYHVKFNTKG